LAAPLIVHAIIGLMIGSTNLVVIVRAISPELTIAIAVMVAVLTMIALLTDRRAVIVAALTYFGIALATSLANAAEGERFDVSIAKAVFVTLITLGAFVLILGIAWQPLRWVLLCIVPKSLADVLPPVKR